MAISEDYNKDVSLLQEVKMQAQVLVPILKALRAELGKEKADALVGNALRDWARSVYQRLGADTEGSPREIFEKLTLAGMGRIGGDIDIDWLEQGPEKMEFNITGCRYADFFRELGEPELGAVLICESDHHLADLAQGEVEFERTQTIMKGAKYCDFRYKIKNSGA
jgi:predicted hydrocarbon binding protein